MYVRENFIEMLNSLNTEILKMGTLVEEAIAKSVNALVNFDIKLAEEVINEDARINKAEVEIEDLCIRIIATNQPVASDLRNIITCMKVASQLERMGDHAVHVAKNAIRLKDTRKTGFLAHIPKEGKIIIEMIHDALTAFIKQDAEKAVTIAERDREIDMLHYQSMQEILDHMDRTPSAIKDGIGYLFTDHFFERLGDHVTNICEWIVYNKTCEHRELKSKECVWHQEFSPE
jgi:phosphate transport system protein